jgi:uncharacterized protein with PhoU and TrkA domain
VIGKTIGTVRFRDTYGIAVVCIKRPNADFEMAENDRVIAEGDVLIVAGNAAAAQSFAGL